MSAVIESMIVEEKTSSSQAIDREKTCPMLVRVFYTSADRHHSMSEFSNGRTPFTELQIYTWMDATLEEITSLMREVHPDTRKSGTYFDFALVYPDTRPGLYRIRDIGVTCSGVQGQDDHKTLSQIKFQIGDYLDVAIALPPPKSKDKRPPARPRRPH